jgi:hypothetical protein
MKSTHCISTAVERKARWRGARAIVIAAAITVSVRLAGCSHGAGLQAAAQYFPQDAGRCGAQCSVAKALGDFVMSAAAV